MHFIEKQDTLSTYGFKLQVTIHRIASPLEWNSCNIRLVRLLNIVIMKRISSRNILIMMASSNGNISALLVLCEGESTGHRPEMRGFDVSFDPCMNKRLSKQPRCRWFETSSRSFWRHCNAELYLCQHQARAVMFQGYWCPSSLRHQTFNDDGIDHVGYTGCYDLCHLNVRKW